MRKPALLFIIALILNPCMPGCAKAVSPGREAYILAKEHGWIEISLEDENIPEDILSEEEGASTTPQPPLCQLEVKLNNEPFLQENIFPYGNTPPYRVKTGFRLAAPTGEMELTLTYSDCDMIDGKKASVSKSELITVESGMVTPIHFDGENLLAQDKQINTVITLEDIYNRLKER